MRGRRVSGQDGFTLVELMTVVALVGVMGLMAMPAFTTMIARNEVQQVAREVAATLQKSRLLAMSVNTSVSITPALFGGSQGQSLSLIVGNASSIPPNQPLVNPINGNPIPTGMLVKASHVTSLTNAGGGAPTPLVFNPQGLLSPLGTPGQVWVITNVPQNVVYSITISPGGRIRWCGAAIPAGGVCP